jgi:hypothetical protein
MQGRKAVCLLAIQLLQNYMSLLTCQHVEVPKFLKLPFPALCLLTWVFTEAYVDAVYEQVIRRATDVMILSYQCPANRVNGA